MKKTLLFLSVIAFLHSGKQISAQAIPDSSFSIWTHTSGPPAYDDPNAVPLTGNGWQELNFATSPLWGSSSASVFKDSVNFHSSKYSAKIVATVFSSLTDGLLKLPNDTMGIMLLGTIDFNSGKITSGVPFTERPAKLKFWYEYAPVGTDTGFVYSLLTKWNSVKGQHDTVAAAGFYVNTTVSSFTQNSSTYNYTANYLSSGNPDTMIIFVSSCSRFHKKPNPGSTLWLDDFTIGTSSLGVENISTSTENVTVYPNPASNSIAFSFIDAKTRILNIFDITGKKIKSVEMNNATDLINTETFTAGSYIYQITDNSGILLKSGKFTIIK